MHTSDFIPPLQPLIEPFLEQNGIQLFILRTDLNHPEISGNKLYKLKYNLAAAKQQNKNTILTFGGAYSNHIAATAAAGKEYGFKTIGIIRGDELEALNPTLTLAKQNGMQLHFVSRELYRDKNTLLNYVNELFKDSYIIPEGGANQLGVKGCTEITKNISIDFDYICVPCGTGTTAAGMIQSLKNKEKLLGFQVLKAENYIEREIKMWLNEFKHLEQNNWNIVEDYHFGGYARVNNDLKKFVDDFSQKHSISLDTIYTGKMLFGIFHLIHQKYFNRGSNIIAVHTGGLQGMQNNSSWAL